MKIDILVHEDISSYLEQAMWNALILQNILLLICKVLKGLQDELLISKKETKAEEWKIGIF